METPQHSDQVIYPDPEKDYHGHPSYGRVYIALMILFGISLVVGHVFSPLWAIILIFATAIWKTAYVMRNFMHLKYEPFLILIAVAAVLFCLLAFFWGVFPDITEVQRALAPR